MDKLSGPKTKICYRSTLSQAAAVARVCPNCASPRNRRIDYRTTTPYPNPTEVQSIYI